MESATLKNLRKTSLVLFCVIAFTYLLLWLLVKNDIATASLNLIVENLAIPLYLTGIATITFEATEAIGLETPAKKSLVFAIFVIASALAIGLSVLDIFSRL